MNTQISEKTGEPWVGLLLQALEEGWQAYLAELHRCRVGFSEEAVHDLRVATRRIMAIMQLLNSVAARPRFKKVIRMFKEQLDDFDDLRDTQVILTEISESLPEFPQLKGFQKQQMQYERRMLKRLRKKLNKSGTDDLARQVRKVRASLDDESAPDFDALVLQAVDDAYLAAVQRLGWVKVTRPATIHRVRIAFKRFRYMVEIVHPLLAGFPVENLKSMHGYQAEMGDVQDVEVFMRALTDYTENNSTQDPDPVQRYYERRHTEAIAAFVEDMNQLHSFWRAAPDQPFPWERDE